MISSLGKASKWIWGFRFMLFYQPLWDWKCHSPPTQHLVSCLQRYLWTLYRCTVTKANAVWAALRGTFPAAPSSAGHLFLDYSPIPVLLCLWLMLSDSSFSSTFSSHLPRQTLLCVFPVCVQTRIGIWELSAGYENKATLCPIALISVTIFYMTWIINKLREDMKFLCSSKGMWVFQS